MEETVELWESIARSAKGGIWPGRNELPVILMDAFNEGEFHDDLDQLAIAIEDAWTGCEWPARALDLFEWGAMFEAVGYLENTTRSPRPSSVPVLYRAQAGREVSGMSWTDDLDQARWFHNRNKEFGFDSRLLRIEGLNPRALYAHFHDPVNSRGEHEWVVDFEYVPDDEIVEIA